MTINSVRFFRAVECAVLFVVLPVLMGMHPTRWLVAPCLWVATAYAAVILHRTQGFSWREEWQGLALSPAEIRWMGLRFLVSTLGIFVLTALFQPARLFAFPAQKTGLWLLIMLVYPVLSALPQELLFRSFFFRRYAVLFPQKGMLAASAILFGFSHVIFRNPISPVLSIICGFFLASSYKRHRSLKKAALEHALYGDMVFTIGLGIYFILGST